ncbi:hypothetical protein DPMN_085067 [Dreissena polymorpha]|uniref:Uncharacterized protein n=1 Tax=Dreissena polymorpha TaxID=45954 RepID=A0A9D3YG50_DREPO|nr:hypothetical protein DPMN_085067 [Dreissena polymorpha]
MARLVDVLTEKERTNWLKAWLAIGIAKEGLEHFVDNEIQTIHNRIYNTVLSSRPSQTSPCTKCDTANLLKCPTPGMCNKKGGQSVCASMHDTPLKQYRPCPLKICDKVRDEITKEHRFKHGSWKNTSANKWYSDPWEIAKCFLPPDGYKGTSSVKDTDFNGVVSILLNCKHFESKFSFQISTTQARSACLLSRARDFGRNVRHSSQFKVTDFDLRNLFTTLEMLFKDLAHEVQVQDAVTKLQEENISGSF